MNDATVARHHAGTAPFPARPLLAWGVAGAATRIN